MVYVRSSQPDTKQDALIVKGVYGKFKRVVDKRKLKNEKLKKKGNCYK
jgi:hypothetical protein